MMKTKSLVLGSLLGILLVLLTSTTAWATQRTLTADGNGGYYINMPTTGVDTLVIPDGVTTFKLYDAGGEKGNYPKNCDGYLMLTAPAGRILRIGGYVSAAAYFASSTYSRGFLTVYDGVDTEAEKLLKTTGGYSNVKLFTSASNALLYFESDNGTYYYYSGIDFDVTVIDPTAPHSITKSNSAGGELIGLPTEAMTGTNIVFSAQPSEGYILNGLQVKDQNGNNIDGVVGGKWYMGNEISFTMPNEDVHIVPTFTELSESFNLDVTQSGTSSYVIPSGVKSIRLQVIGAQYEIMDNYVTLSAPEGYALLMRGVVRGLEYEGSLYIYDGSSVDEKELLRVSGYSEFNSIVSSGESVMLHYKANYNCSYSHTAVEMNIEVVDLNATYNIVANENMYNGNFSSSHETANGNTLVTLTAHPDSGYVLQGFYVQDENYNTVSVRGGLISNTATFMMPFSNVTVTPNFAEVTSENLELDMPNTGTLEAEIPEGVQSFIISQCFGRCEDAMLVLKAPEGRRVQLGPLWGRLLEKPLRVYDGADSNATLLFSRTVDAEYENTSIDAPYGRYVSSGEYMTVVYKKNENGYEEFFNLRAVIVDPSEPHMIGVCGDNINDYIDDCDSNGNNEDGVITSAVNSATVNTQVSLSAVPNEGKWLNRIRVKDRFGSIAVSGGTWYTSADATFTMPATDVWFEGYYATELTAEGGLTIEKPRNEMLEVEIPDDVESFAINGTRDLSCSSTAPSEPLILKAPAGKIMQLEDNDGNDYEAYYSSFKVFNGRIENPVAADPDPIEGNVSSGTILTIIDFPSDESLVVRLRDVSDSPHKVTVVKKGNCDGSFTAGDLNPDEVLVGTIVRMTVNPDEGCVLNDLYVAVGSEDSEMRIPIDGDSWSANGEFSFMMPLEDVNVVATFVDPNAEYDILPSEYVTNATVTSNLAKAKVGDTVVLTVIPDKDYILGEVEVWWIDENGDRQDVDITGGTWYDNEVKFTMPAADVYYEPHLAYYTYAYYYVDFNLRIPKTGTENVVIPNGVYQFSIVSDATDCSGGDCSDYSYSDNSDGVLTLSAPEGYGFNFNGWIELADEGDFLEIFDGPDTSSMKLLELSYTNGYWESFNEIKTSGRSMTLRFKSNENWNAGGVEIYAYVEKLPDRIVEIPRSSSSSILLSDVVPGSLINILTEKDLDGNYYNNSDGSLTLTAPEGYSLYVYGDVDVGNDEDLLYIYDGTDTNSKNILETSNYFYGIYSSGQSLTFRFKSDAESVGNGLNLYVTVLQKSGSGAVAIYEADGHKLARIDGAYNGKDTVNIEEDIEVDGVEFNREFSTAEDGYSTLMLPFDVYTNNTWGMKTVLAFNDVIDSIVDGVKKKFVVMQALWDADTSTQNIELKANTPYLVKMRSSQLSINGSVTLRKTENTVLTLGDWQVHGTTAYKKWQTGDPELGSVYGFAANAKDGVEIGQFVKAGTGAYIRPMRAYLLYNPSNPEPKAAPANHVSVWRDNELPEEIDIVVVSGSKRAGIAGGETPPGDGRTVIGTINTRTGEIKFKRTYDLKGRPVSGTPKAKGMYIKGKK